MSLGERRIRVIDFCFLFVQLIGRERGLGRVHLGARLSLRYLKGVTTFIQK